MATATFFLLESDLGRLLAQTGWVARIVLFILFVFSVVSWAVIYLKFTRFRRAQAHSDGWLAAFRAAAQLPDPRATAANFGESPLSAVYAAGMNELTAQLGAGGNPHGKTMKNPGALGVAMGLASSAEVTRLEQRMSFLATTGAVTPFIGLFGTVWGIMDAFLGLGSAEATTLRAVAPGIAEALVTTAAGLFAAIPAVIAYNHFLQQIRLLAARMDNFATEFMLRVEKLYP